ncbi:unnamed protein product [Prorocentrum cordatum]|uniref:Uncharacterized protein n=1 Tax=Prorocentrum cordatum TaxID=2364126 RepID=A0ABN9XRA6_9DINO|nr:unnamed protein product [Polarella glacialis]
METASGHGPVGVMSMQVAMDAGSQSPMSCQYQGRWRSRQQAHEHARRVVAASRIVMTARPLPGSKKLSARVPYSCTLKPQMGTDACSTQAALTPRSALGHLLRHRASREEAHDDLCASPLCVRIVPRPSESAALSPSSAECAPPSAEPGTPPRLPRAAAPPPQWRRLLPEGAPRPAAEAECGGPAGVLPRAPSAPRGRGAAPARRSTIEQEQPAGVESICLEGSRATCTLLPRAGSDGAGERQRSRSPPPGRCRTQTRW